MAFLYLGRESCDLMEGSKDEDEKRTRRITGEKHSQQVLSEAGPRPSGTTHPPKPAASGLVFWGIFCALCIDEGLAHEPAPWAGWTCQGISTRSDPTDGGQDFGGQKSQS